MGIHEEMESMSDAEIWEQVRASIRLLLDMSETLRAREQNREPNYPNSYQEDKERARKLLEEFMSEAQT